MDSLQQTSDEAVQENFETTLWSPTRPDKQSSRSQSANSAEYWRIPRGPVYLDLQGPQVEFEAAMVAECDEPSLSPGSGDQSDRGAIVASLKKALPTLLRENSLFRERMYAQSAIEPDTSPTADGVHEKIIREQWQLQRSGSSRLSSHIPSNMLGHQNVLLGKTPPNSPVFKLPHFSSQSTLAAEHAPLHRRYPHKNGTSNFQILESLRKNEILADPLFTLPLHTRPPLPDTASANEMSFLLRTQAQRRRKQIHGERTGESVFPGQERRAVGRRLEHVALGKDRDVWPPSAAHPPALAYSEIDEERVAILIGSPAKECPDSKCPNPITEGTTTRVIRFLGGPSTIETATAATQAHPYVDSTLMVDSTFNMTAYANVDGVSSRRSLYLHPNAQIGRSPESPTNLPPTPVPQGHKARAASIDLIEQFPAPVSVTPEEEPIKRASPPKANIAGFEEHSKRGQKRKQRPESLAYHPAVHKTTKPILRSPLSPRSRNIRVGGVQGHASTEDIGSPEPLAEPDTSNEHAAAGSQAFWHQPSASDVHEQENPRPVTEPRDKIKAQSSPAPFVPPQSSRIRDAARDAGQTTQDRKSSSNGQVPVPILQPVILLGSHTPSSKRDHRHRHKPITSTGGGFGKDMVHWSKKSKESASDMANSPPSWSMNSEKAKEYLRHLNEHVDSLGRERDQAVRKVSVLAEEVTRLQLTVAMLKREVGHWEA